jgi:hypothetical protein
MTTDPPLEPPPAYFPLLRGAYEVAAGLRPLGTDFGNGTMDRRVFQVDQEWPRFRASKLACRSERVGKYVARADLDDETADASVRWFASRLTTEYPQAFDEADGRLRCRLTGDAVDLRGDPFAAFDQLAMQVAEDVCLTRTDGDRDWLAAGHVCSPGHWAIERKIGLPFTAVHEPVPGIAPVNRSAAAFVRAMVNGGPYVRFAWGFGTDDRLNHHPDPPPGADPAQWRGRRFVPGESTLFMRVERQVTWGLPDVGAAVFTIRVSHVPGDAIRADPARRELLRAALLSMSPEQLAYKGLDGSVAAVVDWLDAGQ